MSKTSNKQKYECLISWLDWFKKKSKEAAKNRKSYEQTNG
jgi:hypothetical protein